MMRRADYGVEGKPHHQGEEDQFPPGQRPVDREAASVGSSLEAYCTKDDVAESCTTEHSCALADHPIVAVIQPLRFKSPGLELPVNFLVRGHLGAFEFPLTRCHLGCKASGAHHETSHHEDCVDQDCGLPEASQLRAVVVPHHSLASLFPMALRLFFSSAWRRRLQAVVRGHRLQLQCLLSPAAVLKPHGGYAGVIIGEALSHDDSVPKG
eukprot:CAMPEP_0204523918 /NCGR_PEP_ID=MMETSP0661-20131031/7100_1 /ASSEMBLY_ACC=CAM_ASM_000606 /TAXON_ID=109239 /ORGANISM="Alexandrium margalefi, Strain AMGDE01CS-322" /LENGTH=209 /DNA_ID=CAMNT_0051529645 /DNA_START=12 /DNA_END=642 /DNA_ORIENTATION=-